MYKKFIIIISFVLLYNCNSNKNLLNTGLENDNSILWHHKDATTDTIPGLSLEKWYALKGNNKTKKKELIVAVIDTQIDYLHEDLQGALWVNKKEIPNNGIDDDKNGYIDDVNGWSFTGTPNGGYVVWSNFEFTRIIREWGTKFKDKLETEIEEKDKLKFKEYLRAKKKLDYQNSYYKNYLKSLQYSFDIFDKGKDTLKYFFPKEDYDIKQLDSLLVIYPPLTENYHQRRDKHETDLGALIIDLKYNYELNGKTKSAISDIIIQLDSILAKNLNPDFDERLYIKDNPLVLEKGYGNPYISNTKEGYSKIQDHSTKVSGILAARRSNNKGVKGFSDKIKIMPLNISPSGDEHDKDIAMAIRYAVDNGAKVINMSFGKEFSLHQEWVTEAIKYAEKKDVLIVHLSGNDGMNIDKNHYFPTDINIVTQQEFCDNYITVGSISNKLDKSLISSFSNYGKKNVDIFAPGDKIYTSSVNNKYAYDSGTSLACPMVSGTAALIWLHYPKLTAAQVKQIILESGVSYDLEVQVPGEKAGTLKPFKELSKSGKVVNAYNALLMAEEISKHKKTNIRDGKPGEPGAKNGENGKDGENGKSTYNGKVIKE